MGGQGQTKIVADTEISAKINEMSTKKCDYLNTQI